MLKIQMTWGVAALFVIILCGNSWSKEAGTLNNSDCIKCHVQEPATVEAKGGAHKTDVGCLDCHLEHPPVGKETIPSCDMCHSGTPHYELENCSGCHTNPHDPLTIAIGEDVTPVCLSCHPEQGQEMKTSPSLHAEQDCSLCHPDVHKMFLECGECHEAHTAEMTYKDCLSCHPPHQPKEITYPPETPGEWCAACHGEAYNLLAKNTTKHHELACTLCHPDRHPAVTTCERCHGSPHSPEMHKRHPKCGECHNMAHDLLK